jgi:hypothetical protein
MERVEMVGANVFVLRTRQVGATCWCCGVWERHAEQVADQPQDIFVLEDFGENELEAIAMALSDAYH